MKPTFNFDKDQFFEALSRSTDDFIYIHDFQSGLTRVPVAMKEEFRLPAELFPDFSKIWIKKIHPIDSSHVETSLNNILTGISDHHSVEYRIINRMGKWVWIRERGIAMRDGMGNLTLYTATITSLGKKNNSDTITGLPNKHEFENYVNVCINEKKFFGIMIINIDDFKNINNLYGRQFGDYVLRATGQFIQSIVPAGSKVFRLDGDEFGIIFIDSMKSDIKQVFLNINNHLSVQREHKGNKYYCTLSAGCCKYNEESNNFDRLVSNSHNALDYAKNKGKGKIVFFESKLAEHKTKELKLTELLYESIEHDFKNFELYCQPQVYAINGKLKGGEALLRWHCSEYGSVSPSEFIPILEKTNMIIPVGKWVFEQAVKLCNEWLKKIPDFKMSINVSYIQLFDDDFLAFVNKTLRHAEISPSNIIVEFTESCFVSDKDMLSGAFERIRSTGIQIAMDDFGTGYSSLGMLKEAPADIVKIDKAFVQNILTSTFDRTFIQFVVELCHDVGILVCLEGVEREEEYEIVSNTNLDFIQGYYFGKPQNSETFYKNYIKE